MVPGFSGSMTREETVAARGRKYTFHVAPPSTLRNKPLAVNAYMVLAICRSATSATRTPAPGSNPAPRANEASGLQLNPPFTLLNMPVSVGAYNVFGFCGSIATPEIKGPLRLFTVIPELAARQL